MLPVLRNYRSRADARRRAIRKSLAAALPLALTMLPGLCQAQLGPPPPGPVLPPGPALPGAPTSNVLTYRNNNQRTGVNMKETAFTVSNLNMQSFGKIFSRSVDGSVYAQPLFVPNVPFPTVPDVVTNLPNSGVYNAVYVCTSHNSIYAFDGGGSAVLKNPASTSKNVRVAPLWKVNFSYPALGISPVQPGDVQNDDITPEIGIVGTPVIDMKTDPTTGRNTGTLYVVVKSKESNAFVQRLHALDISTGRERLEMGSPVVISAAIPGVGDGSTVDDNGNDLVVFDPLMQNQQAALTLANPGTPGATLYIAWGSHGNVTPYHGWLMSFNANNLQLTGVYNTTPNGVTDPTAFPAGGGIWMGGAGPAVDEQGNVYVATGVGAFDADIGGNSYGNSVLKLQFPSGPVLIPGVKPKAGSIKPRLVGGIDVPIATVSDYFTPFNWLDLNNAGVDLGSGGIVVLPDVGNSTYPHLMVSAGIEGKIYLISRDNLGQFSFGFDAIAQEIPNAVGPMYGVPAFFNNTLYFQGTGDFLKAFQFQNGFLIDTPVAQGPTRLGFPGATPSITSSPDGSNGIVWTLERMDVPSMILDPAFNFPAPPPLAVLHAYDASNISRELYHGIMAGSRDSAGSSVTFTPPTIANGRAYIGGENQFTAYGFFTANGVTPKPTEADHFIITGAMNSGVLFSLPLPLVGISQKVGAWWSFTAIGPDGNPIKLNSTLHLSYRSFSDGALHTIGNLVFSNSVNAVVNYAFLTSGNYDLYISDDDGHSSLVKNFDLAPVSFWEPNITAFGNTNVQLDHFVLRAPLTAKIGSKINVSVQATTTTNSTVPILTGPGQVIIYDTLPDGTQSADSLAPGFSYDLQLDDFGNPTSVIFMKIVNGFPAPVASANVSVTVRGLGNHVFIATDGFDTGTALVRGTQ